jgi:hypothetical protein
VNGNFVSRDTDIRVHYAVSDIYAVTFRSWRRILLRISILFGILIALFIALPVADGSTFWESVSWFPWRMYLGLVAFLLGFLFGICPLISYIHAKRQGTVGPHFIGLSKEGLRLKSPQGESLVYWSGVKRIVASRSRLFAFISPSSAIILPRRAYDSQASFQDARDEVNLHFKAAKH